MKIISIAFKLIPPIKDAIKSFVDEFKEAKSKGSDGGTRITNEEFSDMMMHFGASVMVQLPTMLEIVLEELGYSVDLDGDGE